MRKCCPICIAVCLEVFKKSRVETRQVTGKFIKTTDWPDVIKAELTPRTSVPRRLLFYGLPTVHKQGCLLRPIVNMINSPTYMVSKYLARLLKPYVGKSDAFVINSAALVPMLLDTLILAPTHILVILDVVPLCTNVLLQQTLD